MTATTSVDPIGYDPFDPDFYPTDPFAVFRPEPVRGLGGPDEVREFVANLFLCAMGKGESESNKDGCPPLRGQRPTWWCCRVPPLDDVALLLLVPLPSSSPAVLSPPAVPELFANLCFLIDTGGPPASMTLWIDRMALRSC